MMHSTSSDHLKRAIDAWTVALGDQYVTIVDSARREAEQCTFPTDQRIPAIIYPGSTEDVKRCVQIANEFRTPIYPISRGRNWGLGSKVPVQSDCVLMDLQRMNRIIEFNDELGYVTLQPGVTFQQVYDYQQEIAATHYLAVGGGPPDASVLGNCLERGTGLGPSGERPRHICNLTVVTGRSKIVRTGFSQMDPSATLSSTTNWGVGPSLDGLFFQSNFGVVTESTVWLTPTPRDFFSFVAVITSESQLRNCVEELRCLIKQQIIPPYSAAIWSAAKFAAALSQHPNPRTGELDIEEWVGSVGRPFRGMKWMLFGGVGSGSSAVGRAKKSYLKSRIKPACNRFMLLDDRRVWALNAFGSIKRLVSSRQNVNSAVVEALLKRSVFLGHPTTGALKSLYWRKTFSAPDDVDPHRDACGVRWLCHELPNRANDVLRATEIVKRHFSACGFEDNVALAFCSGRHVRMLGCLVYDRTQAGQDATASRCFHRTNSELVNNGYFPIRLGVDSMDHGPSRTADQSEVMQELKAFWDPNRVIAPGRYEG
ncbi:FAD-binding oxidoreductase [Stieleria varia]|uniref:4-cresol dehydrogenase [hydroxylating] flavoprotein subunit n=1 Tax=Stieleria varia TaxID=2528005 RepID=A0A5C5ZXK2_9BACT|nr:FAD-dependent oxidoreductase [Stieleria varia]TWT91989.1 4-cresol dehydrogenase [hydroxylating] flavoprotein subunit [Stieleria varia]